MGMDRVDIVIGHAGLFQQILAIVVYWKNTKSSAKLPVL
jgi:hypothetical protein